jgi:hypothetical protein
MVAFPAQGSQSRLGFGPTQDSRPGLSKVAVGIWPVFSIVNGISRNRQITALVMGIRDSRLTLGL